MLCASDCLLIPKVAQHASEGELQAAILVCVALDCLVRGGK